MADTIGIETRSRSRSKTPGLLASENGDSEKRGAKKIPTISLIEEEDDIVEVPSSQQSQGTRPKRQRRTIKAVSSSDTSGEVSTESPRNAVASKSTVTTVTVTEKVKKTINGSDESSEQATSVTTVKKTVASEASEGHSLFNIFNAIKTSTPILSNKRSQRITQETSTGATVNLAEHPAYKEYREAGEYWNKYPKTDYTYSEYSPNRRELSNGVVAMPNMSRRSLEKYNSRIELMIQNNPTEESFLRRKFLSNTNTSFQKRSADLQYDSADEVDLSDLRRQLKVRRTSESAVSRFFLLIINYFYSAYYSISHGFQNIFSRKSSRYMYTPVRKQKGIFRRFFESVRGYTLLAFSKVYLLVSTILCLDTWILYTRSENADANRRRKRFLLLLLILFPLLLLGALLLSEDTSQTKIFTFTAQPVPDFQQVTQYFQSIPSRLPQWGNWDFSLGWFWAPFISFGSGIRGFLFSKTSHEELKMMLDDDNLQSLISHIDNYIDAAITHQFEENNRIILHQASEKMSLIIAGAVKDNLEKQKYQLTNDDIQLILEQVMIRFNTEFNEREKALLGKISSSNDAMFLKIQDQIKQNINLHFNELKLENSDLNLDDILAAIFKSEKLLIFIGGHVDKKLESTFGHLHQHDIEIQQIKANLESFKGDILNKFIGIDGDISSIRTSLGDDLFKYKLENDEKLKKLLVEVDEKLASFGDSHFTSVDASVKRNLVNILGFNAKDELNEGAIKNWIASIFVAKADLEEKLKLLEANSNKAWKLQLDENAGVLMNVINEEIRKQVEAAVAAKAKDLTGSLKVSGGLSEDDVLKIVKGVLAIYDADKTGLVDYALESAGAQVISTRCTESYKLKSAEISVFGIPLWYPSNTPRTVISPSVQPGECWAFQGFPGYLVIQLNNLIHVTGFTLEHIHQSNAPGGFIDSAPKKFAVYGLKTELDKDPFLFGNYQFSAESDAPSLQYFPVLNKSDTPFQIVELIIESNHGNPKYTCLYRFRVHGNVAKE